MEGIGKEFIEFYYKTFDVDRNQLTPLYRAGSMLTFEGQQILGSGEIINKLASLPFAKVEHRVLTMDIQPSNSTMSGIIVMVTGQLITENESNPLGFSQVFHLVSEGPSTWFVQNDVFRLNYG